ncbi:MAG: ribulose bisphosphate carboxylase small subunit [Pseudomonadota bacterium]
MQQLSRLPSLIKSDRLDEVEQLIGQNLCGDWILRIEHAACDADPYLRWQPWGDPFFAVNSSAPVIAAIRSCRVKLPKDSIRLCAEKLRPQTRLIYWVHTPDDDVPGAANRVLSQTHDAIAVKNSNKRAAWRYAAAIGVVASSILLFEEMLM